MIKILEHILLNKIILYLRNNKLITSAQLGFLSKRSTATSLLACINVWTKLSDTKVSVDVLYIDVAKALDTGLHNKLLYKLDL